MRIAVASDGLEVAPYFASTTSFMCYTVTRGIITECQNMPNPALPLEQLVELFLELGIDVLIVGRIEYNIANRLCRAGIEVVAGANGNAADVARGYLTKTLTGVEEVCHIADPTFTIGAPPTRRTPSHSAQGARSPFQPPALPAGNNLA